jgi:hypothetical protein
MEGIRKGLRRVNMVNEFVFMYENRMRKPVKIILRGEGRGRMMEGVNLRCIISTYVNVTVYQSVQLLYANKNVF